MGDTYKKIKLKIAFISIFLIVVIVQQVKNPMNRIHNNCNCCESGCTGDVRLRVLGCESA